MEVPTTLDAWQAIESTKIKALIAILQHHLAEDRAVPLTTREVVPTAGEEPPTAAEQNRLVPMEDPPFEEYDGDQPDKIVVFVAFPSNLTLLSPVSFRIRLKSH